MQPNDTSTEPGEERFRLLVEHSPDLLALYDRHGRCTYVSSNHERVFGYRAEEMIGRNPLDYVHADDVDRVAMEFASQLTGVHPPSPVEFRIRCHDGRYRWIEAVVVDLTREPSVGGILVASRDVSDRKAAELLVHEQSAQLERIARGAPLAEVLDEVCRMVERRVEGALAVVLVREGEGFRVAAAPTLPRRIRAALEQATAQPAIRLQMLTGPVAGAVRAVGREPSNLTIEAEGYAGWWAAPVYSSDGDSLLGSITVLLPEPTDLRAADRELLSGVGSVAAIALERDAAQTRLAYQASHDALTGLPNREHFVARLHELATEHDGVAAVLFLDLDRFKMFNDSAGHDAGDRLLGAVAQRIRSFLRDGDVVARFGGDEFVVAISGLQDVDEVMAVARRLLDVVSQPFSIAGLDVVVSASAGVALFDGNPPEVVLRDADTAMYHAKEQGRARVELFDGQLRAKLVARAEIEHDLWHAVDRDELVVHYQPVMSFLTGRFAAFESLVRWQHPTRGLLGPEVFLDVAEESPLIARIGERTREAAIAQWAAWRRDHPEWGDFIVGVNLSAAELRDTSLPEQLRAVAREAGADLRSLAVEVSERVLASDTEAARAILEELRAMGVIIALDDFGTGSSPLLHLRRLPIHAVKLDGALVAGLGVQRDDNVLVAEVIRLAHRLGLFAIAEGVEHAHQARRLRRYGCLLAQGHHFAPAMPADEAAAWVAARGLRCDPEDLLR